MGVSTQYFSDSMQRNQPLHSVFKWEVTGAKAVSPLSLPLPAHVSFDAITQAQIDAALDSSDEFAAAKFDATAMGDDMFGGVFNFGGQIDELVSCEMYYSDGAGKFAQTETKDGGLTDSTAATEATISSDGNLGVRGLLNQLADDATALDLDGATSGYITLHVYWKAK